MAKCAEFEMLVIVQAGIVIVSACNTALAGSYVRASALEVMVYSSVYGDFI